MKPTFRDIILDFIETVGSSLVVIFILYMWVALPEQVLGASMEPNFYTGQRVLVEKITKRFEGFDRGQVVILNPPNKQNIDYIKRIVGLPGESIKIFECSIYIFKDDKTFELSEDYLAPDTCTEGGPFAREGRFVKLNDNEYFVLGDNRPNSADSRYFGPVEKGSIVGKAIFRFWPLNKIGLI